MSAFKRLKILHYMLNPFVMFIHSPSLHPFPYLAVCVLTVSVLLHPSRIFKSVFFFPFHRPRFHLYQTVSFIVLRLVSHHSLLSLSLSQLVLDWRAHFLFFLH